MPAATMTVWRWRRRGHIAVAAWLLLSPGPWPAGAQEPPDPRVEALLTAGHQALEKADWRRAEELFAALVRGNPGMADAYEGLARALEGQGRAQEAAAVWAELGQGWLGTGQAARAVAPLEMAVRLAPERHEPLALLGRALNLSQRHAAAAEALAAALRLGDGSPVTRLHLAAALWETGRADEAEELLRATLKAAGEAVAVRHQLGRLLLWRGSFAEAVTHLRAVAERRLDSFDVQLELARALEGTGDDEAALAAFRRAVSLAPESSQARYGLARLLQRTGQKEEAHLELQRFQTLTEASRERIRREGLERARLDRAWELLRGGEAAAAAERFAAFSGSVEALTGRALALREMGRSGAAVEALEAALRLDPDRHDLRLLLDEERARHEGGS
jgi:tetratricopeptide (TPR) repeat protein